MGPVDRRRIDVVLKVDEAWDDACGERHGA
jgi:hypothetical protein